MRLASLLLLALCAPALAQIQPLTFGIKGGAPVLTPLGQTGQIPLTLGPTVNFRISSRLSLETGVMFYRMGVQETGSAIQYPANSLTVTFGHRQAHALEIPALARLQLLGERHTWRPYLTLGPAIRRTSMRFSYASSILSGTALDATLTFPPPTNADTVKWNVDPVVGAGVDFRSGRVHLEPEVRYSHWGAGTRLPVRQNQVELLLGFRF
jgi:hypothetical protein